MWIIESILLAIAMAMDAFAVSITNGLSEPNMKKRKVLAIAITFGSFQGLMPLIGFLVGSVFEKWIAYFVPVIGFVILTYLGINMIRGALKHECEECKPIIGLKALLLQGIATSIDALAVGVAYTGGILYQVLITFLLIGVITFLLCSLAVIIGKKFGEKFSNKAELLGGTILIGIGLKFIVEFIISLF